MPAPRYASWVPYGLVALAALTPVLVGLALYGSISGQSVDASQRAHVMGPVTVNVDLWFLLELALPLPLASFWLLAATWRWHWARRPVRAEGDPPYR